MHHFTTIISPSTKLGGDWGLLYLRGGSIAVDWVTEFTSSFYNDRDTIRRWYDMVRYHRCMSALCLRLYAVVCRILLLLGMTHHPLYMT
jgi:hypothetical protein